MLQKWSRYRILEQFFDFPRKAFLIREISRNTSIAQTAVRIHLKALLAERFIVREKEGLYPSFKAAGENTLFKLLKSQNIVLRLHRSGLLDYLEKELYPSCLVLFGSASRGEDVESSDVDLFIQAKQAKLDLSRYEKALNRKVNILFEAKIETISPELLNNISNGIVLYGYLKVK